MDQATVFLEYEYIFGIAVIFVIALMYLFYVKFPYKTEEYESSGGEGHWYKSNNVSYGSYYPNTSKHNFYAERIGFPVRPI